MKTFTNKYINQYEVLNNAVIGFEFEFYTKRSYYKLLELLNNELNPIKVWGFRKYHSSMTPDAMNFKIEPDLSGGKSMIELITGPMDYVDAKIILLKILKLLQDNTYTDESCSIHINISFNEDCDRDILDLNTLKLLLNIDEDIVYNSFPDRKNNFYAKSIKKIIPFKEYTYSSDAMNHIISNLELPDTKYYGVNIKEYTKGWLEYRYIGGKDYQYKTSEILDMMNYFILLTWNNIGAEIDNDDREKLHDYLCDNISLFKQFNKYEDFIGEFPSIKLEVDRSGEYAVINTYFDEIHEYLFDLLTNTYNLRDALVNYDSENLKIEIIDTLIKGIFDIRNWDFILSNIIEGTFFKCSFQESKIQNSHLETCTIMSSEVTNAKLTNCKVDEFTTLENVYFNGGYLDGEMLSGVFRGGIIGENAIIGEDVRIVTDSDNYFGADIVDDNKSNKIKKFKI